MTSWPTRRDLAGWVLASGLAWLAAGGLGLALAVVLLAAVVSEGAAATSRHAALAAAATFAGSVLATLSEASLRGAPTLRFVVDRPIASALGATTGALVLASTVLGLAAEPRERT